MKLTKEVLLNMSPTERKDAIFKEYYKCKTDIQYCIETYFSVVAGTERKPFILFPHQARTLDAYETYQNIITMKTRQMGFTTFTGAWLAAKMMTNRNFHVLIISKKLLDTTKFIGEIKSIIDEVIKDYPWLCKGYVEGKNNKQSFTLKEMESSLLGQSTTEDAGRGMSSISALVVDEVAFIDKSSPGKMDEIVAAAGVALTSVMGKFIAISTPKGQSGWYYDTYNNAKNKGFHIVNAHWTEHPNYKKGTYRWVPDPKLSDGGFLKFYNNEWPDKVFDKEKGMYVEMDKVEYDFIRDGKLRSPWYDYESSRIGAERTRCELDCSFMGTGGEVLDADLLRELQIFLDGSEFKTYTQPFKNINGIFKEYKEYKEPIPGKRYVISADVATGDGSDFSAAGVIDAETLDIVGTFKMQLIPDTFGKFLFLLGERFFNPPIIVENAGGGGTTLQTLKVDGYPNIYYSILRKNDPSTGLKKRKIGLWPSLEVRWQGGDRLEQVIRDRSLTIFCQDVLNELNTWIWDKDAKRRHAPEKNDDLIMAIQHGIYYIYYVLRRADRNRAIFINVAEIRTNGIVNKKVNPANNYSNLGGLFSSNQSTNPNANPYLQKYGKHSINIDKESGMNLPRRTM